jgi:HPt (histidine-containing phosphotransfer) domain-containing protein
MENSITYRANPSISGTTQLYDLSMLEEMDDNEYLLEILTIFLSEASSDFKEMKVALQQGNLETLGKKAHKLKGSTGVIQAEKLGVLLAEIENLGKKGSINDELTNLIEKATSEHRTIEKALQIYIAGIK